MRYATTEMENDTFCTRPYTAVQYSLLDTLKWEPKQPDEDYCTLNVVFTSAQKC